MRRFARVLGAVTLAGAAVGCATATGGSGAPDGAPANRPFVRSTDDRVVIPSMTVVQAVAINDRYAFIATPNGLGVYDRNFGRWLRPFTRADGWPPTPITAMIADPADIESVWFAADVSVFHYRVSTADIVRTIVSVPVAPPYFYIQANNPAAGVIVRSADACTTVASGARSCVPGLARISPNGMLEPLTTQSPQLPGVAGGQRVDPQTLRTVLTRYPTLQDYERLLTRDASMRSWPVISAASALGASEVWFGTGGGGAFKIDPIFARGEQEPFGLLGEGAGAIALAADGVWIGSIGRAGNPRDGITFTDHELSHWRWIDGGSFPAFAGARVTAISQYAASVWVATDRSVSVFDVNGDNVTRVWDGGGAIPEAIIATNDGAWVGTARGLTFVHAPGDGARGEGARSIDPTIEAGAVHALARRGDTLWIASSSGVQALAPGEHQPRRIRGAAADARLGEPMRGIATSDSLVAVVTERGDVLRIHARTGAVLDSLPFVSADRVGRVNALAMDPQTIWVAGDRGVLVISRARRTQRFIAALTELAGEAYGVVLTREYAWIASREAAVRLRRTDDGMVR